MTIQSTTAMVSSDKNVYLSNQLLYGQPSYIRMWVITPDVVHTLTRR